MWYIFDSNNNWIATCDNSSDDLPVIDESYTAVYDTKKWHLPGILLNADGVIEEKPPVLPTDEELLAAIKYKRDRLMNASAYVFMRQMTGTPEQKLSVDEYAKWETYWAALRDFPAVCDIHNPVWPVAPVEVTNG